MSRLSHLTTKEVARLCRVSDATVKRWEDAGMLRSERTGGGHRRFRVEEIARFQQISGIGLKKCHNDDGIVRTVVRRRENKSLSGSPLFDALLEGCEEQSVNLILGEYLKGTLLSDIFDQIISPALFQIGELWYLGELTITQEHLALRVIYNAIHKLRSAMPVTETKGKLALCCAIEGDLHELATLLAQIILENSGWEVINFGANTPLYCLSDEAVRYKPDLICITAKTMPDGEKFCREFKSFREQINNLGIPVVLGGRIFQDTRFVNRFEAALFPQSFAEFENFILNL